MIKVLPSSNPEKEENLVKYVKTLEDLGVEYLHCDVMDGVFVENKCLSIDTIKDVKYNTNILLDVHLMIKYPHKKIEDYLALKPNILTIHYESVNSIRKIKKISKLVRSKDILFGVSIKPNTPVTALVELIDYIDLILIMSVEPGKSGQKFIPESIQKIKDAKCLVNNKNIIIEVDGGVNLDNYKEVVKAGAEFLVMGNAFYNSKEKDNLLYKIDKHYSKFKNDIKN
jgi:ribulose-phosphate 3-epimerase